MENEQTGTAVEIKDPQAVLNALDRAKNDAKKFREEKEALQKELESRDQAIARYSGTLLREKVQKEIDKLNIANNERIFKYLDLQSLDFDEDFNVVGLDQQIDGIKTDFPELFDPKLMVGGKADSADNKSVNTTVTASQLLAKIALGR